MRSSSKTAAGALLGALLTVALTGCAPVVSGPDPEPTATAAPSVTAPPEPVQTPEPDPVPTPGEVIDASDKSSVPDGLVAYPLEGRDYLVLDPEAPLPQQVIDDMTAQVSGYGEGVIPGHVLNRLQDDTGKQVIVVDRVRVADGPDEVVVWALTHQPEAVAPPQATREAALTVAQEFVAAQPDPGAWVILVAD